MCGDPRLTLGIFLDLSPQIHTFRSTSSSQSHGLNSELTGTYHLLPHPQSIHQEPLRSPRWQSLLNPHPWLSRLGSGVFVEMVKGLGDRDCILAYPSCSGPWDLRL